MKLFLFFFFFFFLLVDVFFFSVGWLVDVGWLVGWFVYTSCIFRKQER